MEFRNLGRTGVKVSCLCFGTDNFADPTPEEECLRMLDRALDAGINLLDTGDVYDAHRPSHHGTPGRLLAGVRYGTR